MINLLFRLEPVKSFEAPTPIFSASLHPSKSCFVAGGDDFKLYKFDYADGKELGNWCVTFSNNFSLQLKLNMQTSIVCRPRGEGYSFIWAIYCAALNSMVFQPFWSYIGYRFLHCSLEFAFLEEAVSLSCPPPSICALPSSPLAASQARKDQQHKPFINYVYSFVYVPQWFVMRSGHRLRSWSFWTEVDQT